jgi:hypothetical protein
LRTPRRRISVGSAMADPALKDLLARSSLAFAGTVQSLGQSPEPGVAADDHTALVRVEQPLHVPRQVDLSAGSTVVVQLAPDEPLLAPGDRATFFADPLIYGATLVVAEVARSDAPAHALAAVEAREELAQDAALEHARAADAVVRGSVSALQAAAAQPQREHDPHWWIATLVVDMVARGDVAEGDLKVLYANSIDVRWRRWPKPKAGEAGMWVLHANDQAPELAPYVLMHPEDRQPSTLIDQLIGPEA